MDFLKILRSFEDFVFEAATWLVFFPRTLWRILRRPLSTMAYSDREQDQDEERRFDDALSPPLLLLTTIVVLNMVGVAAHVAPTETTSATMTALTASPERLVLFRSLVFSLIPLVSAVTLLRRRRHTLGRETLRRPFYAQCYLAAPCAVFVSAGGMIAQRPDIPNWAGIVVCLIGAAWFLVSQTRWFHKELAIAWWDAGLTAVWAVLRSLIYLVVLLTPIALI